MKKFRVPVMLFLLLLASSLAAQSADQLYSGGRSAFTDGLWTTAASQFSRLLREYPDDHRADSAAYMAAVAHFNAGEYDSCIGMLETFPGRYPESAWNRRIAYWEGLARYETGDWRKAASAFERQSRLAGDVTYRDRSFLYLGACRENMEEWAAARRAYEELVDSSGDYELTAKAVFRLGQIALRRDDPAGALEHFRALAFDYPSSSSSADAEYWMAEAQRRLGRDAAALDGYRAFLATVYESEYRSYALLEAARLASASGEAEEAIAYLDLRDEERGGAPDAAADAVKRIRAACFLGTGRLEEARTAYLGILSETRDPWEKQAASFDLSQTFIGTDEVALAVPYLESAMEGPDERIAADAAWSAGGILLHLDDERGAGILEAFAGEYPGDDRREEALRLVVKRRRDDGDLAAAAAALDLLIGDYGGGDRAPSYYFLRGDVALDSGDETAALADYGALARSFPDSDYAAEAEARIGFIYSGRGEHARAAEHFEEAASLSGGAEGGEAGRRHVYSAGVARLNSGAHGRAAAHFLSLVESGPGGAWGPEAAYHLGEARYESGDFPGAREAYSTAMRYGEGRWAFDAAYATGWAWFRESAWEEAAAAFRRAAGLAPSAGDAAKAEYRVGLSEASAGRWEAAVESYSKALETPGGGEWREEALYQSAWALLNLGRDAEAGEISSTLVAEYPESGLAADLPFRMGEDAMAAGKYREAISWYDRCRSEYPGTDSAERAGLRAALAAKEAGEWDDAAGRYAEWLESRPEDPRSGAAARSWADCVRSSGDPSLAASARREAEEIFGRGHPVSVPMVLAWARVLGIPVESRRLLEEAADNQDIAPADRAEALLLTAHRYRMDGRTSRSRQLYEVLVRDVPGRIGAEAQEGLALSLAEEGEIDAAAEAFLSVSYLYPDQTDIAARSLRQAEKLYREAGRDDEADAVLGKMEEQR